MKKMLIWGLIIVIVLVVSVGCTKPNTGTDNTGTNNTNTGTGGTNTGTGGTTTGNETTFKDGTFKAEGKPDERGWKGTIEITVEGGKITTVNYDEVNDKGAKKSEDTEYGKSMKSASGVTPSEAYEKLKTSLVETQDPDAVEVVSGATESSDSFKTLAKEALSKSP